MPEVDDVEVEINENLIFLNLLIWFLVTWTQPDPKRVNRHPGGERKGCHFLQPRGIGRRPTLRATILEATSWTVASPIGAVPEPVYLPIDHRLARLPHERMEAFYRAANPAEDPRTTRGRARRVDPNVARRGTDRPEEAGRAGVILGGIITLAVGVGLFIMGPLIEEAVYAGSVPVTVGIGMLIYAFFFAPKPAPPGSDNLK